jgi:hypothetical protein
MNWLEKEWADIRPQLKYDIYRWIVIFSGGAVFATAVAFMRTIRRIPEPLFYGILFVASCGCFGFLVNRLTKRANAGAIVPVPPALSEPTEQVVKTAASLIDATVIDDFYRTCDSRMLTECESIIRAELDKHPPADRDRVSLRLMTAMMISYIFESIWFGIFKSQIEAMQELNRHNVRREGLRSYYDVAFVEAPWFYASYSFDQWIGWLRAWSLIAEEGEMVIITIRGGEFLKWLIECRRAAADKSM